MATHVRDAVFARSRFQVEKNRKAAVLDRLEPASRSRRRWTLDKDDARDVVEKLIETCRDGENGYRDAAEHVKSPQLKQWFEQQSGERSRFAQELESLLSEIGERSKKESGSVSAAMHRAWIDLKSNLGGGDKAILSSVEQGED